MPMQLDEFLFEYESNQLATTNNNQNNGISLSTNFDDITSMNSNNMNLFDNSINCINNNSQNNSNVSATGLIPTNHNNASINIANNSALLSFDNINYLDVSNFLFENMKECIKSWYDHLFRFRLQKFHKFQSLKFYKRHYCKRQFNPLY